MLVDIKGIKFERKLKPMSNVVNLSKGAVVNLSKKAPGLTNVTVGLGWDPADKEKPAAKKGFFSKLFGGGETEPVSTTQTIDCDAFALLLKNGHMKSRDDIVFFNNLRHRSGAVVHCGDNLTGDGDGDDEQIQIFLDKLPSDYTEVVLAVNIYQAHSKGQNFGKISNCFIRLVNEKNREEMCRYDISNTSEYNDKTAVIMGQLQKVNDEWEFKAMGTGHDVRSISDVANMYN